MILRNEINEKKFVIRYIKWGCFVIGIWNGVKYGIYKRAD